jgi:hypothetical protein
MHTLPPIATLEAGGIRIAGAYPPRRRGKRRLVCFVEARSARGIACSVVLAAMKVYVSSTFADLEQYREAVYKILRKSRHDVIAMEDYVAGDVRPLDRCLQDVADSDVYVGIFAWRYGFVPKKDNPDKRSITELEFRKAIELGKDVLIFLLREDAPWTPDFMDSHTGDGEDGIRIRALRDELNNSYMRSEFSRPDELAALVSAAVGLVVTKRQADEVARLAGGASPTEAGHEPSASIDVAAGSGAEESRREVLFGLVRTHEFVSLEWWRRGLEAARAVVKVTDAAGTAYGSGFVLPGDDLHPAFGPERVVVTASFVVGSDHALQGTITPEDARISFEAVDGGESPVSVTDVLWESPAYELVAAVLRIASHDFDVAPLQLATNLPLLDGGARSYIIGYPAGGALSFSISDNFILDYDDRTMHYRTPTEPGCGGSPVFNYQWRVMALHYAGSEHMRRLTGQGTYAANAGIRLDAIREGIRATIGD